MAGKLLAKSVYVTQANWPDYVFEPAYDLRPLPELERYVPAHHHLPALPPAAEVADAGVSLGEVDAQLLRSLEELTLHVIELGKQNQRLQARLDALAGPNNALRFLFPALIHSGDEQHVSILPHPFLRHETSFRITTPRAVPAPVPAGSGPRRRPVAFAGMGHRLRLRRPEQCLGGRRRAGQQLRHRHLLRYGGLWQYHAHQRG